MPSRDHQPGPGGQRSPRSRSRPPAGSGGERPAGGSRSGGSSGRGGQRHRNRSGQGGGAKASPPGRSRQGPQNGRSRTPAKTAATVRDVGGKPTSARRADAATEPAAVLDHHAAVHQVDGSEIRSNRHRARLLSVLAGAVAGLVLLVVLGLLLGPVAGVVAAVVAAAAVMLVVARGATPAVLRIIHARHLGGQDPRLANLVDGLCATFGVPLPDLWVIEDPVPNACALGRRPADGVLVVTTGLLRELDLLALEGVVAHELAHIKRHDTGVSERAVLVLSPIAAMSGSDHVLHAVVGAGREYRADELAASRVRYPPGLAAALTIFEHGPEPSARSCFTGRRWAMTRWIWIDPMVHQRGQTPTGEIDATSVRLAALAEW